MVDTVDTSPFSKEAVSNAAVTAIHPAILFHATNAGTCDDLAESVLEHVRRSVNKLVQGGGYCDPTTEGDVGEWARAKFDDATVRAHVSVGRTDQAAFNDVLKHVNTLVESNMRLVGRSRGSAEAQQLGLRTCFRKGRLPCGRPCCTTGLTRELPSAHLQPRRFVTTLRVSFVRSMARRTTWHAGSGSIRRRNSNWRTNSIGPQRSMRFLTSGWTEHERENVRAVLSAIHQQRLPSAREDGMKIRCRPEAGTIVPGDNPRACGTAVGGMQ